jgi:hypothetical protein
MVQDPQWPLQQALFLSLQDDALLTSLLGAADRIFDHVPEQSDFPYVAIGDMELSPFDTKTEEAGVLTCTIHSWSRYRGMREVREIMAAIVENLDDSTPAVAGFDLISLRFLVSDTLLDPVGLTRHGVQKFRALIQSP